MTDILTKIPFVLPGLCTVVFIIAVVAVVRVMDQMGDLNLRGPMKRGKR